MEEHPGSAGKLRMTVEPAERSKTPRKNTVMVEIVGIKMKAKMMKRKIMRSGT